MGHFNAHEEVKEHNDDLGFCMDQGLQKQISEKEEWTDMYWKVSSLFHCMK